MYIYTKFTKLTRIINMAADKRGIIYDVWDTNNTKSFAITLQKYLTKKGYNTSITTSLSEEKSCPIIALCLLHSRPEADINYTLKDLKNECSRGIILVLLHFRSNDTRTSLYEGLYKKDYPGVTVHDCFLQQSFENMKDVNKKIKKDLKERRGRQQDKHVQLTAIKRLSGI
ncbi:uncharacterized protein LOC132738403 [Ruditapes philippinarum]|uniref:uncharacterized protein LOC132738403 n=1 Tax=Ruditapes philippinarum TaxID=129788 RepID=UPI00295BF509|nr:uncharacterized protein LOC132738403 [Ruditapes philippinarum]